MLIEDKNFGAKLNPIRLRRRQRRRFRKAQDEYAERVEAVWRQADIDKAKTWERCRHRRFGV